MKKLFIDTDVIIDYMKKKSDLLGELILLQDKKEVQLYINPLVLTEYFTDSSMRNEGKRNKVMEFFAYFTNISVEPQIGYLAGELMREQIIPLVGDAVHAATCLNYKLTIVTRNIRHFRNVPGLSIYSGYNID